MPRDAFAFLQSESRERVLLLLLQALVRRAPDAHVELDLTELTSLSDGEALVKHPSDKGDKLVLRFARKGTEVYFLSDPETPPSQTRQINRQSVVSSPSPARHSTHSDLDLALREEEMATRAQRVQHDRLNQARAESGVYPFRTVKPQ